MEITATPKSGDTKTMLLAFLNQNRDVVRWKLEGLSDEAARTRPFASDMNVLSVLQHLALVETSWFCEIFAGEQIDWQQEFGFDFDEDIDAEWHLRGDETLADAIAMYKAAIERANAAIADAKLDDLSVEERGGHHFSLGWTMIHMIEETARHTGHIDIVREHLDETLGYLPPLPDEA